MFTGIVERTAVVCGIEDRAGCRLLTLEVGEAPGGLPWRAAELGESIAVNGVCLTVVRRDTGRGGREAISFEAVAETLQLTTLAELRRGDAVNVERALCVGDAFGGHYVTGHVDGVGVVTERVPAGEQVTFRVAVGEDLLRQVIRKGSIAVDGISLTVIDVDRAAPRAKDPEEARQEARRGSPREGSFTFAAIPHTLERTVLDERTVGCAVNVETDAFGKWVLHAVAWGERAGSERADSSREGADAGARWPGAKS